MSAPDGSGWAPLTDREAEAMLPYRLECSGLSAKAVRRVRAEWREMVLRSFAGFIEKKDRMPSNDEALLIARIIVADLNATLIPTLAGGAGACVTIH